GSDRVGGAGVTGLPVEAGTARGIGQPVAVLAEPIAELLLGRMVALTDRPGAAVICADVLADLGPRGAAHPGGGIEWVVERRGAEPERVAEVGVIAVEARAQLVGHAVAIVVEA